MKKNKPLLYEYDKELASAFQLDCEFFLLEYEKYESCSFKDFVTLWREKAFTNVFADQKYAMFLKDFCENCFWMVKKCLMFPKSIYTQIGAFYLLYGLYYKQPVRNWVKIRITLEEYQKLYELVLEMKNRRQLDAVYIFFKMKTDEVFLFVAEKNALGPEDRFAKKVDLFKNDTFVKVKTESCLSMFQDICSSELLKNFNKTDKEYSDLKKKYSEKCSYIPSFSSTLVESIQTFKQTFEEIEGEPSDQPQSSVSEIYESRTAAKNKAMTSKNTGYREQRNVKPTK
ncbi:unnamed protein product [Phyllotreta striolata]|uniref:snRNA-activating protein complex subunit 1 n=1 Tax=Phyllotreta striolata TaxID=444603 RepID=A0A9N9XIV0_PHYSR|nr:unnamed protein product [Phyllotreta striolata]